MIPLWCGVVLVLTVAVQDSPQPEKGDTQALDEKGWTADVRSMIEKGAKVEKRC